MRWKRAGCTVWLVAMAGCTADRMSLPDLSDRRPPPTPAPANVQEEIRDARFFLPLPDEPIGPATGFQPRNSKHVLSSR